MRMHLLGCLALTAIIGCVWSSAIFADDQAPVLTYPGNCHYFYVIAPGMDMAADASSVKIEPAKRLRALVLGGKRAVAWIETSSFTPEAASRVGYRLAELSFSQKQTALREIRSEKGQIKDTDITHKAGYLSAKLGTSPKQFAVCFSESSNKFEDSSTGAGDAAEEAKVVGAPAGHRLQLFPVKENAPSGGKPSDFQVRLYVGCDDGGENVSFSAEASCVLGQYKSQSVATLPLTKLGKTPGEKDFTKVIAAWLLAAKATPELAPPLVLNNGNLCALWFQSEERVLVVDLLRLHRALLTKLLTAEQGALSAYDFKEKDFFSASQSLGRMLVAQRFAESIRDELGEAETAAVVTSVMNARTRLEELVFRLPVTVDKHDWVVFYNVRTSKAQLLPDNVNWRPPAADAGNPGLSKPVQFKVPNRSLVFLLTLESKPGFVLPSSEIPKLQQTLADKYSYDGLRTVKLGMGIPDQFSATLPLDQDKTTSVKLELCKRDAHNRLLVKLTASDSDAITLVSIFLSKDGKGLPLDLCMDQFFVGRTDQEAGAVIKGLVRAPDFRIVEARDNKPTSVTVWVDGSIFEKLNADKVNISFRYPGGKDTYPVTIKKAVGTGVVEVPMNTNDGETVLDLEYLSPLTKQWMFRPGAVEGLVTVDQ